MSSCQNRFSCSADSHLRCSTFLILATSSSLGPFSCSTQKPQVEAAALRKAQALKETPWHPMTVVCHAIPHSVAQGITLSCRTRVIGPCTPEVTELRAPSSQYSVENPARGEQGACLQVAELGEGDLDEAPRIGRAALEGDAGVLLGDRHFRGRGLARKARHMHAVHLRMRTHAASSLCCLCSDQYADEGSSAEHCSYGTLRRCMHLA